MMNFWFFYSPIKKRLARSLYTLMVVLRFYLTHSLSLECKDFTKYNFNWFLDADVQIYRGFSLNHAAPKV